MRIKPHIPPKFKPGDKVTAIYSSGTRSYQTIEHIFPKGINNLYEYKLSNSAMDWEEDELEMGWVKVDPIFKLL